MYNNNLIMKHTFNHDDMSIFSHMLKTFLIGRVITGIDMPLFHGVECDDENQEFKACDWVAFLLTELCTILNSGKEQFSFIKDINLNDPDVIAAKEILQKHIHPSILAIKDVYEQHAALLEAKAILN